MNAWLVIIDGAGEYDVDFNVLRIEAPSARDAVEEAIAPEMGYGRHDDGIAYVVAEEHVHPFALNESSRRHARAIDIAHSPLRRK